MANDRMFLVCKTCYEDWDGKLDKTKRREWPWICLSHRFTDWGNSPGCNSYDTAWMMLQSWLSRHTLCESPGKGNIGSTPPDNFAIRYESDGFEMVKK